MIIKEDLRPKTSPLFLWHIFINSMEKEPCTKFCGVLISFHGTEL